MKKKIIDILLWVFILIFIACIAWFGKRFYDQHQEGKRQAAVHEVVKKVKQNNDVKNNQNTSKKEETKKETNKEIGKKVVDALNKEYVTENIIAYLESPLVKEVVVHATSVNDFLYTDPNRNYLYNGTVTLYYKNQSLEDQVIALFGHSTLDNTKFGPIIKNTDISKKEMKEVKLFTEEGVRNYSLLFFGIYSEDVFDETNIYTLEGINHLLELSSISIVLKDVDQFKDGEKYMALSTCNDPQGINRAILIYKLIDEN